MYCFDGLARVTDDPDMQTQAIQSVLDSLLKGPTNGPILRANGIRNVNDLKQANWLLPSTLQLIVTHGGGCSILSTLAPGQISLDRLEVVFVTGPNYRPRLRAILPDYYRSAEEYALTTDGIATTKGDDGNYRLVFFIAYAYDEVTLHENVSDADYAKGLELYAFKNLLAKNDAKSIRAMDRWFAYQVLKLAYIGIRWEDQIEGALSYCNNVSRQMFHKDLDNTMLPLFELSNGIKPTP
jgi:hypothetical protein